MSTRLEKAIVDLDDRFTAPASRIAASSQVMARRMDVADRSVKKFDRSNTDLAKSIDYMAIRISTLSHIATTFGTALVPLTTAAVPAVAGLANQLGFAAVAGGTAIVAFQGVGEAVKAMGEYELEPTAKNLEKVREAMSTMGESGRDFAQALHELRPALRDLRTSAQDGLFPGLSDSLAVLESRFPAIERILFETGDALGGLAERGAEAIAGPEWDRWFAMVATEARPALEDMGTALGNVTQGLAELWMAFLPLSRDFGSGLADMSRSFNEWSQGLSASAGFQDFLDYVGRTGPEVLDTLGALSMALIDIGTAAAPIGGVALAAIEGFARALSAIASSDIGPPLLAALAAMRAYSLAAAIADRSSKAFRTSQAGLVQGLDRQKASLSGLRSDWAAYTAVQKQGLSRAQASAGMLTAQRAAAERLRGTLKSTATQVGKTGALIGGLSIATSGAADGIGLTNTASLALMGTMAGGALGAAIGGTAGLLIDSASAADKAGDALDNFNAALAGGNFDAARAGIADMVKQLNDLQSISGTGDFFETIGQDIGYSIKGQFNGRADEVKRYEAAIEGAEKKIRDAERAASEVAGYRAQAAALRESSAASRLG